MLNDAGQPYGTHRIEKLKTFHDASRAFRHDFRIDDVKNVIPELSEYNDYIIMPNSNNITSVLKERLHKFGYGTEPGDIKVKSNAVRAFEVIMDFSPEAADKIDLEAWKEDCIKWLKNEFDESPDQGNIIAVACHYDEQANYDPNTKKPMKNIHMHAIIQPINKNGRLNYDSIVNKGIGAKEFCMRQERFYEQVGKKHGLARGEKGSKSHHETMRNYNRELSNEEIKNRLTRQQGDTVDILLDRANETFDVMSIRHVKEKKQLEKKISRLETRVLGMKQTMHSYEQTISKYEQEDEDLIRKKSKNYDYLMYYLSNHPDRNRCKDMSEAINVMAKWGKQHYNEHEIVMEK